MLPGVLLCEQFWPDTQDAIEYHPVDMAIHAYTAIRTGTVGVTGSTGTLLLHTLEKLRSLADRTLPEILMPT